MARLTLNVSDQEQAFLIAAAAARGCSVSEFLMLAAGREAARTPERSATQIGLFAPVQTNLFAAAAEALHGLRRGRRPRTDAPPLFPNSQNSDPSSGPGRVE